MNMKSIKLSMSEFLHLIKNTNKLQWDLEKNDGYPMYVIENTILGNRRFFHTFEGAEISYDDLVGSNALYEVIKKIDWYN